MWRGCHYGNAVSAVGKDRSGGLGLIVMELEHCWSQVSSFGVISCYLDSGRVDLNRAWTFL